VLNDAERRAIDRLWRRKLEQDKQGLPQSERHRNLEPDSAEFIHALADRDFAAAQAVLAPDIEFKGHTPSMGFVERKGSEAVMTLMREWYATAEALEKLETDRVVQRRHVGYRVRWKADGGPMVFEQHAFYDVDDRGRITRWQFVCSGDQPAGS